MRVLVTILVALLSVGCAKPIWNKPGASHDEFSRDRYACLQSSQQRVGSASINKFGGTSTDEMQTNDMLFSSCMNARGWHLQQPAQASIGGAASPGAAPGPTPAEQIAAATKEMTDGMDRACTDPQLQALWAKSACKVKDITLSQRADTSRLAESDKALFERAIKELTERQRVPLALHKRLGGARGQQYAALIEAGVARLDTASTNLYSGKSTWGEYSNARIENVRTFENDFTKWRAP